MSLRSVPAIAAGAALASTLLPAPSAGDGSIASSLNSLSSVNALTLGAGDSVLFGRGSTCRGQLEPKGSGSGAAPILISDTEMPLTGRPSTQTARPRLCCCATTPTSPSNTWT